MSESERIDHLPVMIDQLIMILESKIQAVENVPLVARDFHLPYNIQEQTIQRAADHGRLRKRQGYSLDMLFRGSRLLQLEIFRMLQEHLLELEMSWVIPDLTITSDVIEELVARSVEAFCETKAA